jgi:predicted ester cyclase
MSVEENKTIARRYFVEVTSGGDLSVADELFSATYATDWTIPDMPRGPEQVRFAWAEWRAAFPDWQTTIQWQIAEGEWVANRIVAQGTHMGELMYRRFGRIAPTGRRVMIPATVSMRISAGQIVEMTQDGDFLGLLQQLGVVPAPGSADNPAGRR